MPMRWLNAFIKMLPKLQAEGSVQRVQEEQIGSGMMEKESAEEIWQAWLEQIDPGRFEEDDDIPSFLL